MLVVLDASVLFPARLRDTLLRAAEAELYVPLWTDEILDEVKRNLIGTGKATTEQAQRLISVLEEYFPEAQITGYELLIPQMGNHPKDRHVLAAAVASTAPVIITSNLKDFPDVALEPWGIEAWSPDSFLCYLFELEPEIISRIVADQASSLQRPPSTIVVELIEMEKQVPLFAGLVREHLGLS